MTAAAKAIVETLGLVLVQGTVLAIAAILIARTTRSPAWRAAVWLVVLAKFALPWGPTLPWSLADLLAAMRGGDASVAVAVGPPGAQGAAATAPSAAWVVLLTAWLAGTAAVIARAIAADRRTRRAARDAQPAGAEVTAMVASLAARMRVKAPRVVVGDGEVGPHVVGVFAPTIVVPPALLAGDQQLARAAIIHELAHVRRRDGLARIVQIAAVALFWFWPVVRLANRRLERAREEACDAWALEAGDVSRPAYARLLVQMAQLRAAAAPALAAPRALDDRVTAVLGPPVRARIGLPLRIALLGWVALALGGARTAGARGPTCVYTPELAEQLRLAHPEADTDGDGVVSQTEACEFQAGLRRRAQEAPDPQVSTLDEADAELLSEPLCCNCAAAEGPSSSASCQDEGVVR
jgi:beta-lactamase regulating signal transducer with metallopeptidase domain